MMHFSAFFSLFASVVCFTLGNFVYHLDKKNMVNKIFVLMCVSISYWAFTDFMVLQAETVEAAYLWLKFGFLWPFTSAFLFHFSLVFADDKSFLRHNFTIFLAYAGAAIISVFQLGTNLVSGYPILVSGRYTYSIPENSLLFWLSISWLFSLGVLGIFVLTKSCLKETGTKRKQATFIGTAFSFPIVISLFSEVFPVLFQIRVPDLSPLSTSVLCVFVGYAIWKYDLFRLDLVTVSETILSIMPDSLVLVSPEGKIQAINQRLVTLLGYCEDELVLKPVSVLFKEEQFACNILGMVSGEQELNHYEETCKTKLGQEIPVSVSASVVNDNENGVVGIVVVVRDITEKKQMENLLVMSEKMSALGQAATMVGHDLRNPLQAIRNAAYCINQDLSRNATDGSSFDSSFRMLQIIEDAIVYSDNIVMDLKDFSTERKPEFRPVDVNELITDSLASCKLSDNVEVFTELTAVPFVNADEAMVKRTFVNILTNGVQAMPEGGTFRISTTKTGSFVVASFQDCGIGMSKETLEKLFTPFFTTKAQGMGMGLAICKKFIELNGGCIEVYSKEGKGTTFEVKLPV